ncbi:MAG: polysaccharide biosynthesis/export family protein [Armatimonadota bacterium]
MKIWRWSAVIWLLLCGCVFAATTNTEYRLAAQDVISVNVLKHTELSKDYTIPPDGLIDFPRIGQITVAGKTTQELAALLKERLEKFLLNPEVTVSLLSARTKSIYVLGSVTRPGQYPLTAGARITELLAAAGDITGERNDNIISLVRGQTVIPIDLEKLLGKDPEANKLLQEGDLLWVQPKKKITVVVSGQVRTPGAVKLREHSTLIDALTGAGDILNRPERTRITLMRGATREQLSWGDSKKTLQDGDVLLVEQEPLARVYVTGHVKNPGAYELPDGGGVLEAITLAGGVLTTPALDQVTIVHSNGANERINLTAALVDGKVSENPKLKPGDQVIVPESNARIAVLGMVNSPGAFPYPPGKTMTVTDAISLAGGTPKRARLSQTAVIRNVNGKPTRIPVNVVDILGKQRFEKNITLVAGDIVFVPETDRPNWTELFPLLYLL